MLIFSLFFYGQMLATASDSGVIVTKRSKNQTSIQDSLTWSISFMKRVLSGSGEWVLANGVNQRPIKGLIDYSDNEPVDTVLVQMNQLLKVDTIPYLFYRKAESISNKRGVPGYLSYDELDRQVELRKKVVVDSLRKTHIVVPDSYISEGLAKAPTIALGDPQKMMAEMDRTLPSSFVRKFNKGWLNTKLPQDVSNAEIDTLKTRLFNWTRQSYNDSILFYQRDFLLQLYRENFIDQLSAEAAFKKRSFLTAKNKENLNLFNEAEMVKVNDSIRMALRYLTERAAADSSMVTITNLSGVQSKIWTANHPTTPMRIFLKNEQNDSLSVILFNNGKGELRMVIDDGVKFQRFTETQKKEITFNPKKPDGNLHKVIIRQIDPLPWKLFGTGTVGFTQTTLSNWAKGGESSLSMLLIGRYVVNYSKKNLKWENLAEFRLGIFNSKTRGLEKNDDKLEFQSRVGYSAFKKWFYSAESNFRTQIAKGYKYPDKANPISGFMAPGYLTFSLGMDYKPNKNFSLFLSPLTSKTTFVRDTTDINPRNFGLEPGHTRLWEPGAIVKLNWHYPIIENIIYDCRAEIFNNYRYTLQKFNVDWEQTLVMQVTRRISTRIMSQVIYDYNVKFPIKDETGTVIDQKAKWQFKELFTLGFNYKF